MPRTLLGPWRPQILATPFVPPARPPSAGRVVIGGSDGRVPSGVAPRLVEESVVTASLASSPTVQDT